MTAGPRLGRVTPAHAASAIYRSAVGRRRHLQFAVYRSLHSEIISETVGHGRPKRLLRANTPSFIYLTHAAPRDVADTGPVTKYLRYPFIEFVRLALNERVINCSPDALRDVLLKLRNEIRRECVSEKADKTQRPNRRKIPRGKHKHAIYVKPFFRLIRHVQRKPFRRTAPALRITRADLRSLLGQCPKRHVECELESAKGVLAGGAGPERPAAAVNKLGHSHCYLVTDDFLRPLHSLVNINYDKH
ncbi:hypothetical protein EVAR_80438_1 [Eumeta japonica]|uniref:Uncharacterized protein n=1 Tax=Eumeta variegata TaxID=151549 RepID=A0A4C1VHM7_EUMVA|nr:hypothetical protein EVAR_80438_1 [Eumeta japonica]